MSFCKGFVKVAAPVLPGVVNRAVRAGSSMIQRGQQAEKQLMSRYAPKSAPRLPAAPAPAPVMASQPNPRPNLSTPRPPQAPAPMMASAQPSPRPNMATPRPLQAPAPMMASQPNPRPNLPTPRPAPAAAPVMANRSSPRPNVAPAQNYQVQKGDTLSGLAKRYNTSVDALAKANNIRDVNKIYAGRNLNISGMQPQQAVASRQAQRPKTSPVMPRQPVMQDASNPVRGPIGSSPSRQEFQAMQNQQNFQSQQATRNASNPPAVRDQFGRTQSMPNQAQQQVQPQPVNPGQLARQMPESRVNYDRMDKSMLNNYPGTRARNRLYELVGKMSNSPSKSYKQY